MKPRSERWIAGHDMETLHYRLSGYIRVRWIFLILLSVAGLITEYISEGFSSTVALNLIISVAVLGINAVFQALNKRYAQNYHMQRGVALSVILADIFAASFLVYSNGGIEARTLIVYALPMVAAGAFFTGRAVYSLALLSGALYDSILWLDFLKIVPGHVVNTAGLHHNFGSVLVAAIFYPATFFMVAFVADYVLTLLAERESELRQSTEALNAANSKLSTEASELTKANESLQQAINEANKLNSLTIGRELKMVELKAQLEHAQKELEAKK